ncbi:MAG: amidohydrolase family protein [Saccharofermentanales bacterium]
MDSAIRYADHIGLWDQELAVFVPDKIFDVHVHIGLPDIHSEISEERKKMALTTFTSLPADEYAKWNSSLYPGKEIIGSCVFGFPIRETDIGKANQYVTVQSAKNNGLYPFLLISPKDPAVTISQYYEAKSKRIRIYGLKPYFDFVDKKGPFAVFDVRMEEFLTDEILRFAEKEKLIIMLHTSGIGVGDYVVRDFISRITEKYTNIKIILAHMGRYCEKSQFVDFYRSDFLDKHINSNIYYDISSVSEKEVYKLIFEKEYLHDKVMFGADLPFGLITGVEIFSKTHGPIFLTRDTYAWTDTRLAEEFKNEAENLTYNVYHCIKALKDGLEELNLSEKENRKLVNKIFLKNALAMFAEQIGIRC